MNSVIKAAAALLCSLTALEACGIGAVSQTSDFVSCCVGDVDGDGKNELVAISDKGRRMSLPSGEPCGAALEIYREFDMSDEELMSNVEPDYSFDLSDISPTKVQLGDVDGDGRTDISVVVYKSVKFHRVMAKRPFFYNFESGNLVPLWLGSRLSRPFDDFVLSDIDGDGIAELISIEALEDDGRVLAVYRWEGFGFELMCQTAASFNELKFADSGLGELRVSADGTERSAVLLNGELLLE